MKSFLAKIFMIVAAAFCMLQGLVLVAVGFGRLSSERLLTLYTHLMAAPKFLTVVSVSGAFFIILGFILLVLSSRTKQAPHMIEVEKEGKLLSIPEKAVKEFIHQIIQQSPSARDVSIAFEHIGKGKQVEIHIAAGLDGVSSIYEELNEIEAVLKNELDRVFEWKDFKITFHLRGVGVDPKKKYFASSVTAAAPSSQPATEVKAEAGEEAVKVEASEASEASEATMAEMTEAVNADEKPIDEELLTRKTSQDKPKGSSFFSKILLGK